MLALSLEVNRVWPVPIEIVDCNKEGTSKGGEV